MKVLLLCWRDQHHPEGGGSERYLEEVGHYLASQGHEVVFRTALYKGADRHEVVERDGHTMTFSRGGGNLSVYPSALLALLRMRLSQTFLGRSVLGRKFLGRSPLAKSPFADGGAPDVVVDTQNGVPFFASLVSGVPTVVLTHHCHREQWSVAGPVLSKVGWLIESKISPWIHRHNTWVTVSKPSAEEFAEIGVPEANLHIIRNGIEPVPAGIDDAPGTNLGLAPKKAEAAVAAAAEQGLADRTVHLVTLSRLVPHKQIEHALDALAAVVRDFPNVRMDVISDGWWADNLREYTRELGIEPYVVFHGHVSEELKHRILARAAIHVMPSRKEGWGLAVIEAAQHGVPTVGYESSAGLRDSIVDHETGLLAGSPGGLINAIESLLSDPEERKRMGAAAKKRADGFSWSVTGQAWDQLLHEITGRVYAR